MSYTMHPSVSLLVHAPWSMDMCKVQAEAQTRSHTIRYFVPRKRETCLYPSAAMNKKVSCYTRHVS